MTNVTLFDITFPVVAAADGEVDRLYYRLDGGVYLDDCERQRVCLDLGGRVSFDTFFNLFSYRAYIKYTTVKTLTVSVRLKGKAVVSLKRHKKWDNIPGGGYETDTICQCVVDSAEETTVVMERELKEPVYEKGTSQFSNVARIEGEKPKVFGFYFVEVIAFEKGVEVYGGRYSAEVEDVNSVHLAIGICTYKREEDVVRNVRILKKMLIDAEDFTDPIDILIADNGNTLGDQLDGLDHVHVFDNKNFGGSGGFTRTLIEAWYRRDEFTHVLLMDDDIIIDPKVVAKTIAALKVLKPAYAKAFLGGSTLHSTSPYFQYEQGSHFSRTAEGCNRFSIDLITNLLESERIKNVDFCGWTYTCLPIDNLERNGLPLPFFIKGDDLEYAVRSASCVIMFNGIGIWHEPYAAKHSSHLTYFDVRNKLVIRALHSSSFDVRWETDELQKRIERLLNKQQYDEAEFAIMAGEDFLRGVDFFLGNHEDAQIRQLLAMKETQLEEESALRARGIIPSSVQFRNPRDFTDKGILKFVDGITGNGNRLPRKLQRKQLRTVNFDNYDPIRYARSRQLLHWSEGRKKGMLTKSDPKRYKALQRRMKALKSNMEKHYVDVAYEYRNRISEITSLSFWEKHLGLSIVTPGGEAICYKPYVLTDIPVRKYKKASSNRRYRNSRSLVHRRDWVDLQYGNVKTFTHRAMRRLHMSSLSHDMRDMKAFHNIHKGKRCFIVCPGPSLTLKDLSAIKDEYTFGVNSIFNVFKFTDWRPNYYVMYDASGYRRQDQTWEFDSFATDGVFLNKRIIKWQREHTGSAHPFIVNHRTAEHSTPADLPMCFEKDASVCIYDRATVTNAAIDIALYMGFKEIYLLGVDHNYTQKDGRRHFMATEDDAKRPAPPAYHMFVSTEGYEVSAQHARARKAKIFNCTRGGKLEVFPRKKLGDVLKQKKR